MLLDIVNSLLDKIKFQLSMCDWLGLLADCVTNLRWCVCVCRLRRVWSIAMFQKPAMHTSWWRPLPLWLSARLQGTSLWTWSLTFLNGLCGSLNEVICQYYFWYRRGKNFTKLWCNEYNSGLQPVDFWCICEVQSSLWKLIIFLSWTLLRLSVCLYFIFCF